jgi:hypothetical protein
MKCIRLFAGRMLSLVRRDGPVGSRVPDHGDGLDRPRRPPLMVAEVGVIVADQLSSVPLRLIRCYRALRSRSMLVNNGSVFDPANSSTR